MCLVHRREMSAARRSAVGIAVSFARTRLTQKGRVAVLTIYEAISTQ